jgi:hypothetical protein
MKIQVAVCDTCGEDRGELAVDHVVIKTLTAGTVELDVCAKHLHQMIGRGVPKAKIACPVCGEMKSPGRGMTGHVRSMHPGVDPYNLNVPEESSDGLRDVMDQTTDILLDATPVTMAEAMKGTDLIACSICGEMFKPRGLTIHMTKTHGKSGTPEFKEARRNGKVPRTATLADAVRYILKEHGEPMTSNDIRDILDSAGIEFDHQHLSTLIGRTAGVEKVGRATFALAVG